MPRYKLFYHGNCDLVQAECEEGKKSNVSILNNINNHNPAATNVQIPFFQMFLNIN